VDAFRIAERVRANIAALSIIAPGATGGERVQVTVSVGVAALDSGSKREYAELMAAADAAMYRAKAGGRDQVQMISTTRGLSAISGAGRGSRTGAPSAFRRAQNSLLPPAVGPGVGTRIAVAEECRAYSVMPGTPREGSRLSRPLAQCRSACPVPASPRRLLSNHSSHPGTPVRFSEFIVDDYSPYQGCNDPQ
jgi:hypothetical protein